MIFLEGETGQKAHSLELLMMMMMMMKRRKRGRRSRRNGVVKQGPLAAPSLIVPLLLAELPAQ